MRIDITNAVEGKQYPIEGVIPANNDLFDDRGIRFDSVIGVKGYYEVDNKIVNVNVTITADYSGQCDKCLADVSWSDTIMLNEYYFCDDTTDVFHYDGYEIELDEAVIEKIIFNTPRQLLCNPDCKGLCPKCGINLNTKQCNCRDTVNDNSPFAILKSIAGGAENGSTKV